MNGYFQILVIILTYILLLFFSNLFSKNNILTPEFVFIACFLPQLIYALFYVKKWDLYLSLNTVLVYILGGLSFVFFSIVFRFIFKKYFFKKDVKNSERIIKPSSTKLVLAAIFQIYAIYVFSNTLMQVSGKSNIISAVNWYTIVSKGVGVSIPNFAGKLNLFSYTSGFVWIYYILHSYIYKYKTSTGLLVLNFGLSLVSNLLTGSRGGAIQNIIFGIILFYILYNEKNEWRVHIPFKAILTTLVIGFLLVLTFQQSLQILGRSTSITNFYDYIAHYLCAEVKNLDIKITEGAPQFNGISEWNTLNRMLSSLSKTGLINVQRKYQDASQYVTYNGIAMGNVYTIYYDFIRDLSYLGLIVFTSIMAFISQLAYCFAIERKSKNFIIELSKMAYSYILIMLMFSFFGNWFYGKVVSTGFVWSLIIWTLTRLFMENKVSLRKIYIFNKTTVKI